MLNFALDMTFLEKLFYFIVSTCGFAAALIIHYLLVTKPAANPSSSQTSSSSSSSAPVDQPVIRSAMAYRPRGVVARAVYEKVHNDQYLDGYDMKLVFPILVIFIHSL